MPFIALAGLASLIQRRRMASMHGSAFGRAMNTQTTTPTNSMSQAATSTPQTAQTPAGQANSGMTQFAQKMMQPQQTTYAQQPPQAGNIIPTQSPGNVAPAGAQGIASMAARIGAQKKQKSIQKDLNQPF